MRRSDRSSYSHVERGYTLVIALIMLAALALLAAAALKSGTTNLRAVGNMQARQETMAASQAAIERTISSQAFAENPALVAANPIGIDVDGDGNADYQATLTPAPTCYNYRTVRTSELDPDLPADIPCLRSSSATTSAPDTGAPSVVTDSLCADSEWNVRAQVVDAATGARVAVNQGIAIRGVISDAVNNCP